MFTAIIEACDVANSIANRALPTYNFHIEAIRSQSSFTSAGHTMTSGFCLQAGIWSFNRAPTMSNTKPAGLMSGAGIAGLMLLLVFGLAACLGGGGDAGTEPAVITDGGAAEEAPPVAPPAAVVFTPPAAIPVAPLPASINAIPGVPGSVRVTTDTTGMSNGDGVLITATAGPYDGVTAGAYDGTFVVSNVTPPGGGPGGTFDVAITFTAPSGGVTTQIIAAGAPPGCVTAGDTGDINPVTINASRYVGVAPLGVIFSAVGTLGTLPSNNTNTRAFHELDYQWDFDEGNVDPAIGNWGTTVDGTGSGGSGANPSRKTDAGPIAAHVYATPGTYRVKLTVKDVNGKSVTNNCIQIAVQDPEVAFVGKTACFSNTADFTGCPASVPPAARITTSNFVTAMANDTTYKRLLFHRGHAFDAGSRVRMLTAGPGLVAAFGAGAAPKARLTYNGDLFSIGGVGFSDWRIVDLDLDMSAAPAPVPPATPVPRAIRSGGNITQLLLQRLFVHDGYQGYTVTSPGLDQVFIVDSTFQNLMANATNGQAVYLAGSRVAYMGNRVDVTRSHNTRFPFLSTSVLSHNHHNTPGPTTANMRVLGPDFTTTAAYTFDVVVAGNKFVSNSQAWMLEVQPQSDHNDERHRNVIVERNFFQPTAVFRPAAIGLSGNDLTARNNIFDMSLASGGTPGISVGRFGACTPTCEPKPYNIDIFHNTVYSSAGPTGSRLPIFELRNTIETALPAGGAWGVRVKHNLGYAPNKSDVAPRMIKDDGSGAIIDAANNSSDADLLATAPPWVSPTPSVPAHFDLTGPAVVAGPAVVVPVMSDFFGTARPNVGAKDIGAAEF